MNRRQHLRARRRLSTAAVSVVLAALASVLASGPVEAADPGYTQRRLPVLAGYESATAMALNDAGTVVGFQTRSVIDTPVKWAKGRISVLKLPKGAVGGQARDINNSGVIVGTVRLRDGSTHAAIWTHGRPRVLQTPPISEIEGLDVTFANGVSDAGVVVGSTWAGGEEEPLSWSGPGSSWHTIAQRLGRAVDVNSAGRVIVMETSPALLMRGSFGQVDGPISPVPTASDAYASSVQDINESGTVVGFEMVDRSSADYEGVAWVGGVRTVVPVTLPAAINDSGVIAGAVDSSIQHVNVVDDDGRLTVLPGDGWLVGINNAGVVAGNDSSGPVVWVP